MKDLKDKNLLFCCDEIEISKFLIKNLMQDLRPVLKRYISLNDSDFNVKIKLLKGDRYLIEVKCLTDFLLVSDNI